MSDKMTVVIVEPQKKPYITEIEHTLEAEQAVVGGNMQSVSIFSDPVVLLCNEDGKLKGLERNRVLRTESGKAFDIVRGTFFICGIDIEKSDFCSLTPELAEKYKKMFLYPEAFIETDRGVMVVPSKPSIREELNKKVQEKKNTQREPQAPKRDKSPEL